MKAPDESSFAWTSWKQPQGAAPPLSPLQSLPPEKLQKELASRPNPLGPDLKLSFRQLDRSWVEEAWRTRLCVPAAISKKSTKSNCKKFR